MPIHKEQSPLAGKTIKLKDNVFRHGGKEFEVKDWWDRCSGFGWKTTVANPVCIPYALRVSISMRPEMLNDEVLYGKIGQFMYLVHVSELDIPEKKTKGKK